MARNEQFAAARADRRLTEGQLSELVAEWVRRHGGRRPAIDADHVSRIERGQITWPGKLYREAFRAVLGAASDAELGFYSRRSRPENAAPARLGADGPLLALASAATLGALSDATLTSLAQGASGQGTPPRIGRIDVDDLHRVIDGMDLDHSSWSHVHDRLIC